jgi:ectoine hydroxylase-related dioxygenase (phytanoyl-CoA dioxygenase family)
MKSTLQDQGYALCLTTLEPLEREFLRRTVFRPGEAGTRCLLDVECVCSAAGKVGRQLMDAGVLSASAVAIQAIAFDKSPDANWKVTWHQDLMFPFAKAVSAAGFESPSMKDGVDFARPPVAILEDLLAVRVHLDDCGRENGPLRVAPATHRLGIIPIAEISQQLVRFPEVIITASDGEALLMRPLLLHASSKAVLPLHRRVLHLVYHSGAQMPEQWHRAVMPNKSLQPTPTAVMPPAAQEITPAVGVAEH